MNLTNYYKYVRLDETKLFDREDNLINVYCKYIRLLH